MRLIGRGWSRDHLFQAQHSGAAVRPFVVCVCVRVCVCVSLSLSLCVSVCLICLVLVVFGGERNVLYGDKPALRLLDIAPG